MRMTQRLDKRGRFSRVSRRELSIALSCGVVCLFVVIYFFNLINNLTLLLSIALSLLCVVPLVHARYHKTIDMFEIIYPFSAYFFIGFPLRALFISYEPLQLRMANAIPYSYYLDYLDKALVYMIIGFSTFLIGYYSRISKHIAQLIPKPLFLERENISVFKVMLVFLFGCVFRVISLELGYGFFRTSHSELLKVSGSLNYYLVAFGDFAFYGTFLIAIMYYMDPSRPKNLKALLWCLFMPLDILYGFVFVAKKQFIIPMLVVFVAINYFKKRIATRQLIITLVLVVFIIFPVINFYRASFSRIGLKNPESFSAVGYNFEKIYSNLSTMPFSDYMVLSIFYVLNRNTSIDNLAAAIKFTPQVRDFQYGKYWALIPAFAFIPRAIWKNKPDINYSVGFGEDYLGHTSGVSWGTTNPGDFYMNFGVLGIAFGMFVLGVLFKTLYRYFVDVEEPKPLKIFIYAFLMLQMINGFEGNIAAIYSAVLKTLLFLVLIALFVIEREVGD